MERITPNEIKDTISIVGLLARLGFSPSTIKGKEQMYLSMLRPSDTKPSLSVNDELGVWFDHGTGQGGTVIDFGLAYWNTLSFAEVLDKLVEVYNLTIPVKLSPPDLNRRKRLAVKLPHYKIEDVLPLGNNQVITDYLKKRGIWNIENDLLKEIYYYVEDEKKLIKHFFAVGWKNELTGWEVRNKYFKGCLGKKAVTFLERDASCLAVFEGYMNYLSWKRLNPDSDSSVLVLNSLITLGRAMKISQSFSSVGLYLDHDLAGRNATTEFLVNVKQASDKSDLYLGHNDLNDKLVKDLGAFQLYSPSDNTQYQS